MSTYRLPPLPYDGDALEPYLGEEALALHHDHHHREHVEKANEAIERLNEARRNDDLTALPALERELAFNLSGHILHSIFWRNLSPTGGGLPGGAIAVAIARDFGGFTAFENQLRRAASTILSSGWAALVWDPILRRLGTTQIHDHQSNLTAAGVPLLVVDVWEHAYYPQYGTRKDDYLAALWNLWSWEDVEERLFRAQALDLGLGDVAAAELVGEIAASSSPGSGSLSG